jgi:DNA-directed RNA polymerase specialized sigma24 family protein
MTGPERTFSWWDREIDSAGRPIRADVRLAAHGIWDGACRRAQSLIADCGQAAELMESSVAQVSRYLDRESVPVFSRDLDGLLMCAFRRALYRHVAKLRRLEPWGGIVELSNRAVDRTWARQIHTKLELEQVVRLLGKRSRTILALRYAGYTWKESGKLLGTSVSALRSAFWRDVNGVRAKLNASSLAPTKSTRIESQASKPEGYTS